MHVSLDSALGRQRRLNSVGESVLQIAPSAAAAYSLRSLTGGDPKVVRVRRASDNHEQDFTASEVSSGALTSFVNAQVVAPLDIQALTATGRDGAFLIAKAAYSLRSLGTRQATLAATGDTVARADGKFVAQVRRNVDGNLKSFTATEVTDGTLLSFVNESFTSSLPLDVQGSAAAAYSLRNLSSSYSGNVVEVRRSSDDTTQNFTATEVTDGTLLAFVGTSGSDNGFVKTWYDQSGNSNNAVQGTPASQPKIVIDGNLLDELDFDGTDDTLAIDFGADLSQANSLFMVHQSDTTTGSINEFFDSSGSASPRTLLDKSGTDYRMLSTSDAGTGVAVTTDKSLIFALYNGASSLFAKNGTATGALNPGTSSINQNSTLGSSDTRFYDGTMQEFIVYNSDQSSNRRAIEESIATANGITLGSFNRDGFVKTWYDQSVDAGGGAHGNHATQATAANQPKIVNAGTLVVDSGIAGLDFDGSTSSRFLVAPSVSDLEGSLSMFSTSVRDATGYTVSPSSSSSGAKYFGIQEGGSSSVANPRNATNVLVSDSVSGVDRLTFALTTGATSTSVGTLGSAVTTSTSDYGDDFDEGDLDQIAIGLLRTVSASGHFNGRIREILVYTSDQTDNRTAIEANIGEAYSIDLPSGVDPGFDQVDGFVETWYDQSGNSKDAIQTTASLQPVIVAAGVFQNGLKFDTDGSSSGPDFRTPIDSAELSNDPAGHAGFALVWVGNVNASQHNDSANHTVLGNLRNVQNFPTGTIGLSVTPTSGTVSFINEQGGSTREDVVDTNALTPGNFGVAFFSYEDAEGGFDPLLSVDGSVTTSGLSDALSASSTNDIGIMTAINGNNTVRYENSADGICKEVLLYTGDQKSKRAALETNIAAEYGITLS